MSEPVWWQWDDERAVATPHFETSMAMKWAAEHAPFTVVPSGHRVDGWAIVDRANREVLNWSERRYSRELAQAIVEKANTVAATYQMVQP